MTDQVEQVLALWDKARAFMVDHRICGDWSIASQDEVDDGNCRYAFYIYGPRGMIREYFIDDDQINNGKLEQGHLMVTYYDDKPLLIEPLVDINL